MSSSSKQHRDDSIDAFRGVAIISVLLFHYLVRWDTPYNNTDITNLSHSYPAWLTLGALGVQLFFVISGLVITMTVIRSKSVIDFAIKRFSRLYPAYLFSMLLITGIFLVIDPLGFRVGAKDFFIDLTMMGPILRARLVDGAHWSLTPEIFFYFWTAMSWLVLKQRFWIGLILVSFLGLVGKYIPGPAEAVFLAPYSPYFLAGVALWMAKIKDWRSSAILAIAAGVLYAAYFPMLPHIDAPDWAKHLFLLGGLSALTLSFLLNLPIRWAWLAYIGRISYSLYLIHQNLGVTLIQFLKYLGLSDIVAIGGVSALAIGAAHLMFNFVEQPGQKLFLMMGQKILTSMPLRGNPDKQSSLSSEKT